METAAPQEPTPESIHPLAQAGINPRFHGSGGEYFRIWIVNFALTIITLGIYLPWAKVRTRRYFYRATVLNGYNFDYIADPLRLLIGYLIVGAGLFVYTVGDFISFWVPLAVFMFFIALYPWIRRKSVRFFAANSTYRNVSLGFRGTTGQAYAAFMGWPMLSVPTMGLILPYAAFKGREFYFANFNYGNAPSSFAARPGYFYKVYLIAGLLVGGAFALGILSVFGVSAITGMTAGSDFDFYCASEQQVEWAITAEPGYGESEYLCCDDPHCYSGFEPYIFGGAMFGLFAGTAAFYLLAIIAFAVVRVLILNYCWSNLTFETPGGKVVFRSFLHPGRYIWIMLTNFLLVVLTVGVFLPFAKVRMHKYRLKCLEVTGPELLDHVAGLDRETVGAVGESATDWLDIEFGL